MTSPRVLYQAGAFGNYRQWLVSDEVLNRFEKLEFPGLFREGFAKRLVARIRSGDVELQLYRVVALLYALGVYSRTVQS